MWITVSPDASGPPGNRARFRMLPPSLPALGDKLIDRRRLSRCRDEMNGLSSARANSRLFAQRDLEWWNRPVPVANAVCRGVALVNIAARWLFGISWRDYAGSVPAD